MRTRTKTDSDLQRAVLEQLQSDPRVEEMYLGVTVEQGVVTLTGMVGDYTKRIAAEEAARMVDGVHHVINEIQVGLRGD